MSHMKLQLKLTMRGGEVEEMKKRERKRGEKLSIVKNRNLFQSLKCNMLQRRSKISDKDQIQSFNMVKLFVAGLLSCYG